MLDQWGQAYHGALALPTPLIASQLSRNQIEEQLRQVSSTFNGSKSDCRNSGEIALLALMFFVK